MNKRYPYLIYPFFLAALLILAFSSAQAFELQWYGQSAFKIPRAVKLF